jgi:tetratricopeptide (TPR) repeat protein
MEIELIKLVPPGSFEKDLWEMSVMEKYRDAQKLKEQGAQLFRQLQYKAAANIYLKAGHWLQTLITSPTIADLEAKRKADPRSDEAQVDLGLTPEEEDQIHLKDIKSLWQVVMLNYTACEIKTGNFAAVVQVCGQILQDDRGNVKAYFRRGQALAAIGRDLEQALSDLEKALKLAPNDPLVLKELNKVQLKRNVAREKEKTMFRNVLEK